MKKIDRFFEKRIAYANILVRIIVAWRCIVPAWLFISGAKPTDKFVQLLTSLHFPFPVISAYVSVYAQFICGALILLGLWTRAAAIISIIHFLIIILTAHIHDTIVNSFTPWALLAMSVSLLFTGGGKWSLDDAMTKK